MSASNTCVPPAYVQYIAERTQGDDPFLIRLKEAATAAGLPAIWISPEQASLMQILLHSMRAERVLEIGTLAGYSAITMARALPAGGHVDTIEFSPKHAEFARRWIRESDVSDRVQVHLGDARVVLETFDTDKYDAAFIDADKVSYDHYLNESLRLLRPAGMVMVDNAFAFGHVLEANHPDEDVETIRRFNDDFARRDDLRGTIVPVGDGLWVATKK